MNFKRFLPTVFAAALTAGTSTAAPVIFTGYAGASGNQFLSVTIDGFLIGSYSGAVAGSQVFSNTVEEADGWHTISIDYKNFSGSNGMTLIVNGGWAAYGNLQSRDASNIPIYGLRGDYLTLGGAAIKTDYGETSGGYLHYTGGTAPWTGTVGAFTFNGTAAFEEQLTGKIYFGTNPTPPLDQVQSDPPPTDPPPTGDGNVPEPGGLWLVVAALPLMLFSKRNFILAKIRQS